MRAIRVQQLVAGGVPEPVVESLEVVEVDQQHRERRVRAVHALDLARQLVLEEAVIVQLREAVGDRELVQHLVRPLELGVALQQAAVGRLDLHLVAAQLAHHVVEGAREQPDLVVRARLRNREVELALRDAPRRLGERLDRAHRRPA